ncbi:polyhydroxyalkanoate granule-associated phasin [Luteimonas saliphila]|uniref:polyhydroxyalkanoate granule-associated phasin n=1 Tax=Luteimonas saliphila TaxID=2804919 RepID=UPI00192D8634|nr:polyhydroxyalkanoate granule-associated phasin [Luteimonas saliphila]
MRLTEMATDAQRVASTRLTRMALAGASPSARDRREFNGMVVEKQIAFAESWVAMWTEAWHLQTRLALSWMRGAPSPARQAQTLQSGLERIAARGMAPVQRRVRANARRLRG